MNRPDDRRATAPLRVTSERVPAADEPLPADPADLALRDDSPPLPVASLAPEPPLPVASLAPEPPLPVASLAPDEPAIRRARPPGARAATLTATSTSWGPVLPAPAPGSAATFRTSFSPPRTDPPSGPHRTASTSDALPVLASHDRRWRPAALLRLLLPARRGGRHRHNAPHLRAAWSMFAPHRGSRGRGSGRRPRRVP